MAKLQDYQKEKIKEIISDLVDVPTENVVEEVELSDGLGMDSLDVVDMIMRCEKEFDCNIPYEDYADVKTVGDVFKIVENRI